MNISPSILIFGSAPDLLETRRLVLQYSGFDVTVSHSMFHTTELLISHSFNLFILCHSLSSRECESALQLAHSVRPQTKNLLLSKGSISRKIAEHDTLLDAFTSPQNLIAAAKSLTSFVAPEL